MAKMDIAHSDRVRVKLECLRLLATLKLNRPKLKLISGFVDAYLDLSSEEQTTFEAEVEALPTEETDKVMEIVTSWMKEGLKQGRTEGRREGRTEGRRQGLEEGQLKAMRYDVVEILEARFKKVPYGLKSAIRTVKDRKRLRLLLRQAATVASLKEFERHLPTLGRIHAKA
jgi:flagellar biosynthesis/type III secretory pathway protein FliH